MVNVTISGEGHELVARRIWQHLKHSENHEGKFTSITYMQGHSSFLITEVPKDDGETNL